jgi:hypothetical protein
VHPTAALFLSGGRMSLEFAPDAWNQTIWQNKSQQARDEEITSLEGELKRFLKCLNYSGSYRLDGNYSNA